MPSKRTKKQKKADKYPKVVTPVMTLVYPFLQQARDYKGDENFVYRTDALLGGAQAVELISKIDAEIEKSCEMNECDERAKPPYRADKDKEGKETGLTRFRFKVAEKTKTRRGEWWDRRPAIFDAQGHPLPEGLLVGTGTKAQISFQWYHWGSGALGGGVSLQPVAIMIHEFVPYSPRSADPTSYGFETNESGFGFPTPETTDDDDDDDDIEEGEGDF